MDIEEIKNIINKAKKSGYEIGLRDISYVILRSKISDAKIAYSVIFGNESENVTSEYDRNAKLRFIKEEIFPSRKNISFEENRERLIDLIDEIQAQAKLGGIKAKDAVAQEAAIRVQLERTFSDGVKEDAIR